MLKTKDLVKWKKENNELIARYIQESLKILNVNPDESVSTKEAIKISIYLKILTHNIELPDIPALESKQGLIQDAVFHLKTCKKQDSDVFRHILAARVRRYLNSPVQEYRILFPLHVNPAQLHSFRSFRVLGETLWIRDWRYIQKHFMLQRFSEQVYIRFDLEGMEVGS